MIPEWYWNNCFGLAGLLAMEWFKDDKSNELVEARDILLGPD
jgi:hypothetical protein